MDYHSFRSPFVKVKLALVYVRISVEKITEAVLSLPGAVRALLADRLVESLNPIYDDTIRETWAADEVV